MGFAHGGTTLSASHENPGETGTTWWVDASGSGLGSGTSDDPFTSISFGVSRSFVTSGDSVVVAPGTYANEEVDFQGKSLTLRSSGGPGVTTIVALPQFSPTEPHPAIRVLSGNTSVVIEGFHITGGTGSLFCSGFTDVEGGAIEICGPNQVTVRNCAFDGNRAERGGAIFARDCVLRIEDCLFTGPGTEARGEAIYLANANAVVTDSVFMDLYLASPDIPRGGGAVVADQSTLLLQRCMFERNATRFFGAHVWCRQGDVTVSRCAIGSSTGLAGASMSASGGVLRVIDSTVRLGRSIQAPGAGIFGSGADVVVEGSLFEGNRVEGTREGGAIAVQAGQLTVTDSRFFRNSAGQGGAIATSQSTNTLISDCRFEGNFAPNGGGAFFSEDSTATMERSAFVNNEATPGGTGGAVLGRAALVNCSLAGNVAGFGGGAAAGSAQLVRSIAWGNAPLDLEASTTAQDSMVGLANGATVSNPIPGPPRFWSDVDLHLLPGSPGIDALQSAMGLDPDGSQREVGAFVFDPRYCPEGCRLSAGTVGCVSETNSTGQVAELTARGSRAVDENRLVLLGANLPPRVPTLMLASMIEGFQTLPLVRGPLCLGSPILRLLDLQSVSRFDGTAPAWVRFAAGSGEPGMGDLQVQRGQTWLFQLWFRDSFEGSSTNTSNSVQVTLR